MNDPAKPLSTLTKSRREAEWVTITERVLKIVKARTSDAPSAHATSQEFDLFAQKLRFYCLKALDLRSAFEVLGETARYSQGDLDELNGEIHKYNQIIEELLTRGTEYALDACRGLPPDLASESKELLSFALEEIHRTYAFQLNEVRVRANRLQRGEIAEGEAFDEKALVRRGMQPLLRGLSDRVPILQTKVDRLAEKVARLKTFERA
jgi:hypothetical protein